MPAIQRGAVDKKGKGWRARWYDDQGARRSRSGFETKSAALDWLDMKTDEVLALRRGDVPALRRQQMPMLSELVEEYLAQHSAEANTLRTLRARLSYATKTFGSTRVDRLDVAEIGRWRKALPERSAWAITKTLRQVLHYAVRVGLVERNIACAVANPEPKRREVQAFASVEELEAVGAELDPCHRAIPVVVGLTGLRPEEWIAL
jgi:hypothetical protein